MSGLVLVDSNAKVGGLVQIAFHASNPVAIKLLSTIGALNTTWNTFKPLIEKGISSGVGRTVVLLNGNYVKQKKGVVSYHNAVKVPGAIFLQRKGFDSKTNTFWMWVIIK